MISSVFRKGLADGVLAPNLKSLFFKVKLKHSTYLCYHTLKKGKKRKG